MNIPYGSDIEGDENGILFYKGKALCCLNSKTAIDYFVQNGDGFGDKRAGLINEILYILSKNDEDHQAKWNAIWNDEISQAYRREDSPYHWIWSRKFYDAPIFILEHILGLVKKGE